MFDLTEYAKLCRAIYEFGAVDGWSLTEKMNGDTINAAGEVATKNLGFRAGLYIHSTTQSKVIAIAGADFMGLDPSISLKCLENRMQKQVKNISEFCQYLVKKYPNELFEATGHALGGSCAIYLAIHHQCITTYTFNAPDADYIEDISFVANSAGERVQRYYVTEKTSSNEPIKMYPERSLIREMVIRDITHSIIVEEVYNFIFDGD